MLRRVIQAGILLISLLANSSFAQQDDTLSIYDMTLEELRQIKVYSASRNTVQQGSETPVNIRVVTSQQIKERGYTSLIDILEDMPGFKIDRGVDPRWMNDITLRGVRYMDKIIILMDGVRISSPTNEIISVFENYPVHHAKQVEVMYGPASAIYGADAFSGVINIVTKDATKETTITGSVRGGMYNTFTSNVFVSKKLDDKFELSFGGQYFSDTQPDLSKFYPQEYLGIDEALRTGTFNTIFGEITPETPVDSQKAFPLEAWMGFFRLGYKGFRLTYFSNHARNPTSTANTPNNSVYNEDQFFGHDVRMLNGRYTHQGTRWSSTTQFVYSSYLLDEESNFRNVFVDMEPAYKYARGWKLKIEQLISYDIKDELTLNAGINHDHYFSIPRSNDLQNPVRNDNIDDAIIVNSQFPNQPEGIPADLIEVDYTNVGGYLEVLWQPSFYWYFVVGSRIDKDSRFSATINPRIGVAYNSGEKFNAKFLFSSAFLAPSPQNMFDRFGTFQLNEEGSIFSSFFALPNPELEPQRIKTAELKLNYFFTDQFSIDVSAYYSNASDLISPVTSSSYPDRIDILYPDNAYVTSDGESYPVGTIQINDNLGEMNIYGGNMGLKYQWEVNGGLSGELNVDCSLIEGQFDLDEDGPMPERNLPGVSPVVLRVGGIIRISNFSVDTRFTVLSAQRTIGTGSVQANNPEKYQDIGGYHLLNVFVNYSVTNRLDIFLSGRNLTDQRYRNVNIGARPELTSGAGAGIAEFVQGAPQNPIRIEGGLRFSL